MSNKVTVLYTCSGEQFVRYLLMSVTILFSILEMIFFPSIRNLCGCLMALVVCFVHSFFCIKGKYWLLYPFPTAVMTSIFIYRWLPLIATFIEGKPISYCLEIPYITYSVETVMYLIAVCAYLYVIKTSSKMSFFQRLNLKLGLFDSYHPLTLWVLGLIGLYAFTSKMLEGSSELGDVGGKFLNGLMYLQYVPLVFIFPDLCKLPQNKTNKILAFLWSLLLIVMGIASNGRKNMIAAFFILFVLAFLHFLSKDEKMSKIITIPRMIIIFVFLGVSLSFFQSMSRAQLATRSIRKEVKGRDLLDATVNAYEQNDEQTDVKKSTRKYIAGWSEGYLDNDFLNRYCNIRISDESLWHAFRCNDYDCAMMRSNFVDRILYLLPSPIISFFHLDFDKSAMKGSRGDYLYSLTMNKPLFASFRVIAHSGDGFATFGLLYFPLQFIVWIFFFKLYDSFSLRKVSSDSEYGVSPVYCILGLSLMFVVFNYGNGHGIVGDVSLIIRSHWQRLFLFVLFVKSIDKIMSSFFYGDIFQKK